MEERQPKPVQKLKLNRKVHSSQVVAGMGGGGGGGGVAEGGAGGGGGGACGKGGGGGLIEPIACWLAIHDHNKKLREGRRTRNKSSPTEPQTSSLKTKDGVSA